MLPFAEEQMPLLWVFQQDSDPKHTSRKARQWFLDHSIKNLWADVKKSVSESKPTNNNEQLRKVIKESWEKI